MGVVGASFAYIMYLDLISIAKAIACIAPYSSLVVLLSSRVALRSQGTMLKMKTSSRLPRPSPTSYRYSESEYIDSERVQYMYFFKSHSSPEETQRKMTCSLAVMIRKATTMNDIGHQSQGSDDCRAREVNNLKSIQLLPPSMLPLPTCTAANSSLFSLRLILKSYCDAVKLG